MFTNKVKKQNLKKCITFQTGYSKNTICDYAYMRGTESVLKLPFYLFKLLEFEISVPINLE